MNTQILQTQPAEPEYKPGYYQPTEDTRGTSLDAIGERALQAMDRYNGHFANVQKWEEQSKPGLPGLLYSNAPAPMANENRMMFEAGERYFGSPEYEEDQKITSDYIGQCNKAGVKPFESILKKKYDAKRKGQFDFYDHFMGLGGAESEATKQAKVQLDSYLQNVPDDQKEEMKSSSLLRGLLIERYGYDESKIDENPDEAFRGMGEKLGLVDKSASSVWQKLTEQRRQDIDLGKKYGEIQNEILMSGMDSASTFDKAPIDGQAPVRKSNWTELEKKAKAAFGTNWSPEIRNSLRADYVSASHQSRNVQKNMAIVEAGLKDMAVRSENLVWGDTLKKQDENIYNAIQIIKNASDEERQYYFSKLTGKEDTRGWWSSLYASVGRGIDDMARSSKTFFDVGGELVFEAGVNIAGSEKASRDASQFVAERDERRRDWEILRQFMEGYSPIASDRNNAFENGVLLAGRSAPMMATQLAIAAVTSGASLSATTGITAAKATGTAFIKQGVLQAAKSGALGATALTPSYAGDKYMEARMMNPEAPRGAQFNAALVGGYMDSLIDIYTDRFMLKAGGFLGKTSIMRKAELGLLKKSITTNALAGGAKATLASLGAEMVGENAQNFTNPAMQDLFGTLGGYESNVDLGSVKKEVLDSKYQSTLFYSLLPMAVLAGIGGAVNNGAVCKWFKDNRESLKEQTLFTDPQMDAIQREPDPAKRAEMIAATCKANLALRFPNAPVTADNTDALNSFAESVGATPEDIEQRAISVAESEGVSLDSVAIFKDEKSATGYSFEVRKPMDKETAVEKDITEETDVTNAFANRIEEQVNSLNHLGFPILHQGENVDGKESFFFFSAIDGERMTYESKAAAIDGLAQDYEALYTNQVDEAKGVISSPEAETNAANVDVAAHLDENSPEGARNRFEFHAKEMTLADIAKMSEKYMKQAEARMKIAETQEGASPGGELSDYRVYGSNETYLKESALHGTQKIYAGANPLDVYEERSEGVFDFLLNKEEFTLDEVEGWIRDTEKKTGLALLNYDKNADEGARKASVKEAWSKCARAWVVGNITDERLPTRLLQWFRKMLLTFVDGCNFAKDLRRARALMDANGRRELDANFVKYLSDSVGMNWEKNAARKKRKMENDIQGTAKKRPGEISEALKGRLPMWGAAYSKNDPLWKMLKEIETSVLEKYGSKRKTKEGESYRARNQKTNEFFKGAGEYVDPVEVMRAVNKESGFSYETPVEMLKDLQDSLQYGISHYGESETSMSVEYDPGKNVAHISGEHIFLDRESTKKNLVTLKGSQFLDRGDGIIPSLSRDSIDKLTSGEALKKTIRNLREFGYADEDGRKIHYTVAGNIVDVFNKSVPGEIDLPNKDYDDLKQIRRYYSDAKIDGYENHFRCKITVKEYIRDGNKMYSVEVDIERPPAEVSAKKPLVPQGSPHFSIQHYQHPETSGNMTRDEDSVKSNFSANEAREAGLFNDGVMKAENGTVTDPEISFSIEAKHVSPYSFRKFDTSQVGTGEGRQAFGWGVYFLTNDSVQEYYSSKLGEMAKSEGIARYVVELNAEELDLMRWEYMDHVTMKKLIESPVEEVRYMADREPESGQRAYRDLTESYWDGDDDTRTEAMKQASEALRQSGIKGIQYEDATSRNSMANKTFNYVIFDANDVKITKVNDAETDYEWQNYTDSLASFSVEGKIVKGNTAMTSQQLLFDMITKSTKEKADYLKAVLDRFVRELAKRGFSEYGVYLGELSGERDQMDRILDVLGVIDSMTDALPRDLIGRLYGIEGLRERAISAKTRRGRDNAFRGIVEKIDRALDDAMRIEKEKGIERFLKWAKPRISNSRLLQGKIDPDSGAIINEIVKVMGMSMKEVQSEAALVDASIDNPDIDEDTQMKAIEKKLILETFGGFYDRSVTGRRIFDATRMTNAFNVLEEVYVKGRAIAKAKWEARKTENERKRTVLLSSYTKPSTNDLSGTSAKKNDAGFRNWARRFKQEIFSFDQILKTFFGLRNSEAKSFEERKYKATSDVNEDSIERTKKDMESFKRIISRSLGDESKWESVSDFDVARKFADWNNKKKWDIVTKTGEMKSKEMSITEAESLLDTMSRVLRRELPVEEIPDWARSTAARVYLESAVLDFRLGKKRSDRIVLEYFDENGGEAAMNMSEFEMATILNHSLNPEYENSLLVSGISLDVVEKIKDQIDPVVMEINEYFLGEYENEWEKINKVYREQYGVDMAKHKNYSPGSFHPSMDRDTPESIDGIGGKPLDQVGAIKTRVRHNAQVNIISAWELYRNHFIQMDYWRHNAGLLRDMKSAFLHSSIKTAVSARYGSKSYGQLKNWIYAFSCGGNMRAEASGSIDSLARNIASGMAIGYLSFNYKTILRQFPAATASMMDIDTDSVKGFWYAMNLKKNKTGILRGKYMKQREKLGVRPEMREFGDYSKMKPSRLAGVNRYGMDFIGKADNLFTSFSGRMVYGYQRKLALKKGLSEEEANQHASDMAEIVMRRTAQPVEAENKSLFENYAGSITRLLFLFKSDPRKNIATALFAYTMWKQNEISLGRALSKASAATLLQGFMNPLLLIPCIMSAVSIARRGSGDPDDLEDVIAFAKGGLMDSVSGLPFIGDLLDYGFVLACNNIFDTNLYAKAGNPVLPAEDIYKAMKSVPDLFDAKTASEHMKDGVKFTKGVNMAFSLIDKMTPTSGLLQSMTRLAQQAHEIGASISSVSTQENRDAKELDRATRVQRRADKKAAQEKKFQLADATKEYEVNPDGFRAVVSKYDISRNDERSIVRRAREKSIPEYARDVMRLPRRDRMDALRLQIHDDEQRERIVERLQNDGVEF